MLGGAEGVIKFQAEHRPAALSEAAAERFRVIAAWRRVLWDLRLIGADPQRYEGAGFGNLSARLPPFPGERGSRRFVITGSQTGRELQFTPSALSVVEAYDYKTNRVRSTGPIQPSSESMTHGAIYDLEPRVRCVFHAHAPGIWHNATALRVPTTRPDVAYGTREMAWEVGRLFRESNLATVRIMAMGGHEDGIITFGHSAEEAGEVLVQFLARAYGCQPSFRVRNGMSP